MGKFLSTPSARRATASSMPGYRASPFLSTPSARRATGCSEQTVSRYGYFYPRPPRGGRPRHTGNSISSKKFLSTPSARRATGCQKGNAGLCCISIHALREEGDDSLSGFSGQLNNFYPRPPRGGRRAAPARREPTTHHFYPRPPRGGRLPPSPVPLVSVKFLSTPSARRATSDSRPSDFA